MEMNFCPQCGTALRLKEHPTDGPTAFCEKCGDYRYPVFSMAVSLVVTDPAQTRMILIRQYGKPQDILVAGYVDKRENAEHAARRELLEELGLDAQGLRYLGSHYYEPSETLMLNFHATVEASEANPNWEIDSWRWVPVREARDAVRPGGLADTLLEDYFRQT